ncbi:3'(2'),5'-bisphosphate nucleotidase CysQ [Falsiroseomonas sp. HW251]|uniref:3'(2'),5'-bisphosphate nucleotidase CysQ n=1 Tax=Falsiroseomonas sp. HW251 TaxID=3390998 RepID=UPI003D322569
MDEDALVALAARLAKEAAAAVMAVRAAGFAVERKRDTSPVTAADRLAEALIVEGLREATPDIPVVAEEEVEAGRATAHDGLLWLVDPLDGTREFAGGHDSFAVNIGLVRNGRPWLGVVALPAMDEIFGGIVGRGAWKQDGKGIRAAIAARRPPPEGPVVFASRHYAADPRIADFAKQHGASKVVNIGSAEKFCRLAEGVGDLYPRHGETMEWDTAAPEAVLIAAGGSMADWSGAALRYGKPGWRNPPFLARGAA